MLDQKINRDSLRETNNLLRMWGKWHEHCATYGLGHANQSTLVSALQGSRATAPSYPKDNPEAERVNVIVINLSKRWPQLEQVVRAEYTNRGTPQKVKMLKAGIRSLATYRRMLELAIFSIDQSISTTT